MDKLLDKNLQGNLLWEETDLPATTPSILDHIIPTSCLDISTIQKITYTNGAPVFTGHRWKLDKNTTRKSKKQKQVLDDTGAVGELRTRDNYSSSVPTTPDTSGQSWSEEFHSARPKRKLPLKVRIREQKWARLFNTIYTAMRTLYNEMYFQRSPTFPSQRSPIFPSQRSSTFPFEFEDLEGLHRQWSPELCNDPNVTDIQTPGVVLLNSHARTKGWAHVFTCIEITDFDLGVHRDIPLLKGATTKGYLMMREQPWRRFVILFSIASNNLRAHYMDRSGLIITRPISIIKNPTRLVDMLNTMSLANSKAHGMDPTMHMCDDLCAERQCDLGGKAIGWIEDKNKDKLLIISILWRSQGLFSRGTICYRVRDRHGRDFALKDCWVDEEKRNHEEKVLEIVRGIPNVVTLVDAWDVEYEGEPDSTARIRQLHGTFSPGFRCKYHRRLLLTPCGEPLSTYSGKRELIVAFRDFVVGGWLSLSV